MTRAALYEVAVRPRSGRGASLPFDDIDGRGTHLVTVLSEVLSTLAETSKDGSRLVRSLSAKVDGDDVFAVVQYGQRGVAADIVGSTGEVRLAQVPDDLALVRCGCLFRLPAGTTAGQLAVQQGAVQQGGGGRGIKTLLEDGVARSFRARFPHLTLTVTPRSDPSALADAVAAGRVEHVQLATLEPATGRRLSGTQKWVAAGTPARVALSVTARGPGGSITSAILGRFLAGDRASFADLAEFGGLTFTQVNIAVRLSDGSRRVFDLAHPEAGPPLTRPLAGIALDDLGEPTDASLLASLGSVLRDAAS